MYALISTNRMDMKISTRFYKTRNQAIDAMTEDIISMTDYKNLDEIIEVANSGECGFSDNDAWIESHKYDTVIWKITKIPDSI